MFVTHLFIDPCQQIGSIRGRRILWRDTKRNRTINHIAFTALGAAFALPVAEAVGPIDPADAAAGVSAVADWAVA